MRKYWTGVKVWNAIVLALCGMGLFVPVSAGAVSNSISRTYLVTDKTVTVGMAVSLAGDANNNSQATVEKTTPDNARRFVGIVSKLADNLVTLSTPASDVVVTNSGQINGLVSDINGTVSKNNILVASPLAGVLMRADTTGVGEDKYPAIAVALGEPTGATTQQIKDRAGKQHNAQVGMVAIDLSTGIAGQTNYAEGRKTFLVIFIQSLTGKVVSEWQALGAFTVLFAILVTDSIIIYGTVHSAIVALGRNPLSRKSVVHQVLQVFILAIGLLLFGVAAVVLILWF